MLTRPAAKLDRNPTITAFGANGKTVGQSRAGLASFTSLSAMPLKAGTISAIIMRTPARMIHTPAAKVSDWIMAKMIKF
ncbi:hypothetical protein D3C76_1814270 [compost metagenome]